MENVIMYIVPVRVPQSGDLGLQTIMSLDNRHLYCKPNNSGLRPERHFVSAENDTDSAYDDSRIFDYYSKSHRLVLRFGDDRKSRDGIRIGWASDCDIRIPETDIHGNPNRGLSRYHCILTFDCQRRLVLKDVSSRGTTLFYDNYPVQSREDATYIIGGDIDYEGFGHIELRLTSSIALRLIVPRHDTKSPSYVNNVARFMSLAPGKNTPSRR